MMFHCLQVANGLYQPVHSLGLTAALNRSSKIKFVYPKLTTPHCFGETSRGKVKWQSTTTGGAAVRLLAFWAECRPVRRRLQSHFRLARLTQLRTRLNLVDASDWRTTSRVCLLTQGELRHLNLATHLFRQAHHRIGESSRFKGEPSCEPGQGCSGCHEP